jgi:hypothetical protein
MQWLFASELPLTKGLELEVLAPVPVELGHERIREASQLLGKSSAHSLAEKMAPYELGEQEAKQLGLEGICLNLDGEFPALTPGRWTLFPEAESWEAFRAKLRECGAEVVGLSLNREQRDLFLRFLARNHVNPEKNSDSEKFVDLARHFFFSEPLNVVVRYTGPRFHHG